MRPLAGMVLFALFAACAPHPWHTKEMDGDQAYRYRAEPLDYDRLRKNVVESKGVVVSSGSDVTRILAPAESKVFLFTEPTHPAHPAVIVLEPNGSKATPFSAHCGGNIAACETWLMKVAQTKSVLLGALERGSWNET